MAMDFYCAQCDWRDLHGQQYIEGDREPAWAMHTKDMQHRTYCMASSAKERA